jgi:hypothetical protein
MLKSEISRSFENLDGTTVLPNARTPNDERVLRAVDSSKPGPLTGVKRHMGQIYLSVRANCEQRFSGFGVLTNGS